MKKGLYAIKKALWRIIYWNHPDKLARREGVLVGDRCRIMRGNKWGSEPFLISIGDHVLISGGCAFVTHDGCINTVRGLTNIERLQKFGRIVVEDNVSIGTNCIIMPGVKIGRNSVIGAGSLVNKSIPEGEVWAGVPAKYIQTIDEYVEKTLDLVQKQNLDMNAYKKDRKAELIKKIEQL